MHWICAAGGMKPAHTETYLVRQAIEHERRHHSRGTF